MVSFTVLSRFSLSKITFVTPVLTTVLWPPFYREALDSVAPEGQRKSYHRGYLCLHLDHNHDNDDRIGGRGEQCDSNSGDRDVLARAHCAPVVHKLCTTPQRTLRTPL